MGIYRRSLRRRCDAESVASATETAVRESGEPAIPRAYTRDATQGIPQGGTDVIRFTAPGSGDFGALMKATSESLLNNFTQTVIE